MSAHYVSEALHNCHIRKKETITVKFNVVVYGHKLLGYIDFSYNYTLVSLPSQRCDSGSHYSTLLVS